MQSKVAIGLVGPGWIGEVQLRKLLARPDVQIVAVHGRNQDRTVSLLAELGLPESCYASTYEQMLERLDVAAVWISSPNHLHGPQAIAALHAGKHVFCEKPSSITFRDHITLHTLAGKNPHLSTFVDYLLYFNPMEQKLFEMIRTDLLGDLTQVQVNYRHPVNITGNRVWKLERAIMGDAISMGINHALSILYWIFQANGQHPVAVFATSEKARVRDFEPDPIWNITITFSGGGTAFCFGNIDFNNGYDAYHNITGTKGAFVFDAVQPLPNKLRYCSQHHAGGQWIWPLDRQRCIDGELEAYAWDPAIVLPDSGNVLDHGLDDAIDCFLRSVQTGQASALSLIESAPIAEIGWAAQLSAITGKAVTLPLDPQQVLEFCQ